MSTQPVTQQVRWQDLTVRNEVDMVLEIAHQQGWQDCEVFGHGSMITQPQESMGWKLIPADQYEYSIPAEGVGRVHQIINAGVRIQGIIIADDERREEPKPAPTATPAQPKVFLPSGEAILSFIGKALVGLILLAGAIALVSAVAVSFIWLMPLFLLSSLFGAATGVDYDPKLVILVDDGNGGTVWVSVFTWYE
jgi:hypothetical protein